MARVPDSRIPADDKAAEFIAAAEVARKRRNLFRRADGLQVALCKAADDCRSASLTAEQTAADIETVAKLAGQLKRRHNAAARSAVFAAAAALQSAEYAAAVDSRAERETAGDYAAAGILAELRGIL